jgi:pilus assembly protein CpaB
MKGSTILALAGAVLLGLFAVLIAARFLAAPAAQKADAPTVTAVIATKAIAFGDPLTKDNVQEVPWPAALPRGAFTSLEDALGAQTVSGESSRLAMRAIAEKEVVTEAAVSGQQARLSTSPLLGPDMRAVAVPISEAAGAGGFVAPGDRVDLFVTRDLGDNFQIADQLVQDVRVLAVGQVADTTQSEAVVVKTATLELSPPQAQKVALAQNVGRITLAIRSVQDQSRMVIPTIRVTDLHDGGGRNYQPPRRAAAPVPAPAPTAVPQPAARPAGPVAPRGPAMTVVRGTETAQVGVPR